MVLVAFLAVLYNMQTSVLEPVIWNNPSPLPALTGAYAPNDVLIKTELLCKGECNAPESIAFDAAHGIMYTRSALMM